MASFALMLGTGLSALGAASRASAEAGALEANARANEARATRERAVGSVRGERRYRDAQRLASLQQAEFAHGGGGMGGSAGEAIGNTERTGLVHSGFEVWQGESRARGLEDEAAIQRFSARQRKRAMPLEVGAALLTGVSRVAMREGWGGSWGSGGGSGADPSIYDEYDEWRRSGRLPRGDLIYES
jgi:hypothetical protein